MWYRGLGRFGGDQRLFAEIRTEVSDPEVVQIHHAPQGLATIAACCLAILSCVYPIYAERRKVL